MGNNRVERRKALTLIGMMLIRWSYRFIRERGIRGCWRRGLWRGFQRIRYCRICWIRVIQRRRGIRSRCRRIRSSWGGWRTINIRGISRIRRGRGCRIRELRYRVIVMKIQKILNRSLGMKRGKVSRKRKRKKNLKFNIKLSKKLMLKLKKVYS